MSKKSIILVFSLMFFLSNSFILQDSVYASEDWCYIQMKAEELINYRPRNFQECKDWLRDTGKLLASHTQAINSKGTVQNPQCKDNDTEKSVNKIKSMIESINELAIDYSTRSLPPGWKEIVRSVKKNASPAKITLVLVKGGVSVATGGAAPAIFLAATAAMTGLEIAKEHVGVLEEDGIYSSARAKTIKSRLNFVERVVNLASAAGGGISRDSIVIEAAKVGLHVIKSTIRETSDGYYTFKASSDGVSQVIKLKLPAKTNQGTSGITITFPYIKITKHNIEDISGTLSLTRADLKNKAIEISGWLNDGASGGNTRKVQVNIGTGSGWEEASGRMTWKYSFIPRENYDYRVKIRAIDISGKKHESLFGTIRLNYNAADDEALVRQAFYGLEHAWQDEDINRAMSYFSKDFVDRTGNDTYWDDVRDATRNIFDTYENINITLSDIKILVSGNTAQGSFIIDVRQINSSTKIPFHSKGKNTFKCKKINGAWKLSEANEIYSNEY